jgi:hypothetical protein
MATSATTLHRYGFVDYLALRRPAPRSTSSSPVARPRSRWPSTLGAAGAIRTETLRAFNEDEYRKIIAALP